MRSTWIHGDRVGQLFAASRRRVAHTVVLIVETAERVTIGARKGLDREPASFSFVRSAPGDGYGFVGESVFPTSRPRVLRDWSELGIEVRTTPEIVRRWLRRRPVR